MVQGDQQPSEGGSAENIGAQPVPRQLPRGPTHFTGRTAELERLDALLCGAGPERPSTAVTTVIVGAAGVGKTSLALRWAHCAQERFPDGQLHINLRGYDPSPPMTAEHALRSFLRGLGLCPERIPQDVDSMAGIYRSTLAGRRILVMLDNAATPAQVRPLLPDSPGCAVLITSRSRLSGLVARDGAHRITIDTLVPGEAVALLREVAGRDRAGGEPHAIAELARLCAYLPLALRIAGERVAVRTHFTVGDLVAELSTEHRRLDALAADDDDEAAVRTVFSSSYQALAREPVRVFRLLGVHPGPDISLDAVTALIGTTRKDARRHLDALIAVHLITEVGRDRFQFHDLLRAYAAERASVDTSADEHDAATRRLFEWYLHAAHAALFVYEPQHPGIPIDRPGSDCRPLAFVDRDHADRWFAAEHANLIALVRHAHDLEQHTVGWQLPQVIDRYLADHCDSRDRIAVHQLGLVSAQRARHLLGQRWGHQSLGMALSDAQRHAEALPCFWRAMKVARAIDDAAGDATPSYELRRTSIDQSLYMYRVIGDPRKEGASLVAFGDDLREIGELDLAMIRLRQGFEIANRIGAVKLQATALQYMARVYRARHQYDETVGHLRKAAALCGDLRMSRLEILNDLMSVLSETGRLDEAREASREALDILVQLESEQAPVVRTYLLASEQRRRQAE